MGGDQDWLMLDAYMPIAPVGSPLLVALNQASAKHVLPLKLPLTQATEKMNGSIPLLVRLFTEVLEKPVVAHEVVLPWPQ